MRLRPRLIAASLALTFTVAGCSTSKSATAENPPDETSSSATSTATSQSAPSEDSKPSSDEPTDRATLVEVLPDGAQPFDGIITAGQPSKEDFERLAGSRIKTVVNFRSPKEKGTWDEAKMAQELGLNYVQIVVRGPNDLNRENVEKFDKVLKEKEGDFLVHCGSSNRVGAMFALRAHWIQNKPPEEAIQIGMRAGLSSLESAVRQKLNEKSSKSDG